MDISLGYLTLYLSTDRVDDKIFVSDFWFAAGRELITVLDDARGGRRRHFSCP